MAAIGVGVWTILELYILKIALPADSERPASTAAEMIARWRKSRAAGTNGENPPESGVPLLRNR